MQTTFSQPVSSDSRHSPTKKAAKFTKRLAKLLGAECAEGLSSSVAHPAFLLLTLLFGTALLAASSYANTLNPALNAAEKTNAAARRSQTKIDKLAAETKAMADELNLVLKEIDGLQIYNEQLNRQLISQKEELAKTTEAITQVSVVERQITPLMLRMVSVLKEFTGLDLPFLQAERLERVNNLDKLMDRSNVSLSEKFRKIMEAYAIESDFGRTMEHYPGSLTIDGRQIEVNFLRIGRIALVYQSLDEKNIGIWNRYLGAWEPMSDIYKPDVRRGLKIALKQLTPKLIELPIPAPELAE